MNLYFVERGDAYWTGGFIIAATTPLQAKNIAEINNEDSDHEIGEITDLHREVTGYEGIIYEDQAR